MQNNDDISDAKVAEYQRHIAEQIALQKPLKAQQNRKEAYVYGSGLLLIVVFISMIWPHTFVWDGQGSVDAAPDTASVKNYRLDADMEVTEKKHGWFHSSTSYNVTTIHWPNGGYTDLNDCDVADNSNVACSDDSGNTYQIEVITSPDQPPPDDTDSSY